MSLEMQLNIEKPGAIVFSFTFKDTKLGLFNVCHNLCKQKLALISPCHLLLSKYRKHKLQPMTSSSVKTIIK